MSSRGSARPSRVWWVAVVVGAVVALLAAIQARPASAASISPRDVAVTDDEAGRQATRVIDKEGSDDRAAWVRLRWERDQEGPDRNTGPATVESNVWVAKDLATARAIFQEQSAKNKDFPEAFYAHKGPFPLPISGIGDEVSGLSACLDCNAKEDIFLHHRVTFRRGVVVSTIYLYGSEATAPQSLMSWYAAQSVGRVPDSALQADDQAAPTPPSSDGQVAAAVGSGPAPSASAIVVAEPKSLAITIGEAGKNAKVKTEKDGADERGSWYEVRFEREGTGSRFYQGPVIVHNIVFVARDVAGAERTYQEQVALNEKLPEANSRVGQKFELKEANEIGESGAGISACERSCNSSGEIYVHKRLVSRVGNVVSVVYLWGLSHEEGTSDWHARYFGSLVVDRARGALSMPSI